MTDAPATIDAYLATFPDDVAAELEQVRAVIHAAVPGAVETISYGIPTFTLDGRSVIHVARWSSFLSVYPVPATDDSLEREIAAYRAGKGTLRFPANAPLPYDLIGRIAALLAQQRAGSHP